MLAEPMLAEAMHAEVDNYIARFTTERDEHGRGWWCAAAPISPATSDRTAAAQRNVRHVIRQLLSRHGRNAA